jgi:predicted DsbA family dithiol-disulfide isomerase
MKVTVISDYVCPWCYIGSRRVEQFGREFDVDVTWWPYELHPETPREGRDISAIVDRRGAAFRDHLRQYAAEAGITLASNRRLSNSHRALELAEFAKDRGRFQEVHDSLFRAYFEEGRDIGDSEVLGEIATASGLDPDEFRFECILGRYATVVDEATAVARSKGFTSTPTMIFDDRFAVSGAQDYNVYADALERLGAQLRHPGGFI